MFGDLVKRIAVASAATTVTGTFLWLYAELEHFVKLAHIITHLIIIPIGVLVLTGLTWVFSHTAIYNDYVRSLLEVPRSNLSAIDAERLYTKNNATLFWVAMINSKVMDTFYVEAGLPMRMSEIRERTKNLWSLTMEQHSSFAHVMTRHYCDAPLCKPYFAEKKKALLCGKELISDRLKGRELQQAYTPEIVFSIATVAIYARDAETREEYRCLYERIRDRESKKDK